MAVYGLLFPGQGSQFVGMGKDFYESYETARKIFDKADEIVGYKLSDIIFNGPEEKLKDTSVTQPAIFTVSCALLEVLRESDVTEIASAGHSLGEYAALYAAGYVDFETGLKLVLERGKAMKKVNMVSDEFAPLCAVMRGNLKTIEEVCNEVSTGEDHVAPAIINSSKQVVVGGNPTALKKAADLFVERGAKRAVPLKVSGAFHTKWMKPAADEFEKYVSTVTFKRPKIGIYTNVGTKACMNEEEIKDFLIAQIHKPINWLNLMLNMIDDGIKDYIEIGPGNVVKGFFRSADKTATVSNIEKVEDLKNFISKLNENELEAEGE